MAHPVLIGMCEKERRKFAELERTCNQNCESYQDIIRLPDIPYLDHDTSNHTMDLYYPENPKKGLPIIIDIHGGGLISGNKEFNRPFCSELARNGFIVFAIEYPQAPETPINTILSDILFAEAKALDIASVLKADTKHTCIIGDSGGAFLALYTTAIINNPAVAEDFNIIIAPEIQITALALISGLFYTTANDFYGAFYKRLLYSKSAIDFEIPRFVNPDCEDVAGVLPPCYLITSAKDNLKDYTFRFEKALDKYDIPHVFRYMENPKLQHDFPVMDTDSIEAKGVIVDISNTFKRYIRESTSESIE